MECKNIMSLVLFAAIGMCFIDPCCGYGYGPHYGGFGGACGYASCPTCSPYAYGHNMSPCLKAKFLKKYLALRKPCLTRPLLSAPILRRPCLPCLAKQPTSCYKSATCLKYPHCPYSNNGKCLKHKAALSLYT